MRNLAICPLKVELKNLVTALRSIGHTHKQVYIGDLKAYEFKDLDLLVTTGGHGKSQFSLQTQYLIDKNTDAVHVFCIGSAGGLFKDILQNDIVVGSKTIEYDFKSLFHKNSLPEFLGSQKLLKKINNKLSLINHTGFKAHIGIIASGDEDILDVNRAKEIYNQTKALAVAWEGAGAARACKFNNIDFLEIRAITDFANQESNSDFKANLKTAMSNACEVLLTAIS